MRSGEDVRAAAITHGLDRDADRLAAMARPAWRLVLSAPGDAGVAAGRSKVGGAPDLHPEETWPRNADGVPLTFLAQLSPRDFPLLPDADQPWGHRDELIRIFADIREEPYEPGLAFGLSAPAADLRRAATPEDPEGRPLTPYPEIVRELPERAVTAMSLLTLPAVHPAIRNEDSHWMNPLSRTYDHVLDAVDPDRLGRHQVLGWPEDGHDDTLAIGPFFESDFGMDPPTTEPADWRLLLLLHYSPTWDGDPFSSYDHYAVVIRADDLAAGKYDRLFFDVMYS